MRRLSFPPLAAGEIKTLEFPFVLGAGVTISTQSVAATVYSGTDASPSGVLSGSATASGATVNQNVTGAGAELGVTYELICTITTSDGQTLQAGGYLVAGPNL